MKKQLMNNDYYSLSVDIAKNRAYPIMTGRCNDLEAILEYKYAWEKAIESGFLIEGFTILADARLMQHMNLEIEQVHQKIQSYLLEKGLQAVAQLMSLSDIANMQVSRATSRSKTPITAYSTLEEAEQYLDSL